MPKEILPYPEEVILTTGNITIDSITRDGYTTFWPETKSSADQFLAVDGAGKLNWTTPVGAGNVTTDELFTEDNFITTTDFINGTKHIKETGIKIENINNITQVNSITASNVNIEDSLNLLNDTEHKISLNCPDNLNTNYTLKLPPNSAELLQELRISAHDRTQLEFISSFTSTIPQNNRCIFVSTNGNDTNGNGSFDSPFASLAKAIDIANELSSTQNPITIRMEAGKYVENNLIGPLTIISSGITISGANINSVIISPINLNQPLLNIAITSNLANLTLFSNGISNAVGLTLSGINNDTTLTSIQVIGFNTGIDLIGSGSFYLLKNIIAKNNIIGIRINNIRAVIQTISVQGTLSNSPANPANTGIIILGSASQSIITDIYVSNCIMGVSSTNNCICSINGLNATSNTNDISCATGSVMYLNSIQISGANGQDDIAIIATDAGTNIEMEGCNLDGYNYNTNQRSGVGILARNSALIHIGNSQLKRFITGAIIGDNVDTSSTKLLLTDVFFNNDEHDIIQNGTSSLLVYASVVALSKITINDKTNVFLNFTDTVSNVLSIGKANEGNSAILQTLQGPSNNPQINFISSLYSNKAFTTQNFTNERSAFANISNNNSSLISATTSNTSGASLHLVSDRTTPIGSETTIRGWDITKNGNTNAQLDFNFQNNDETGLSVIPKYNLMQLDGITKKVKLEQGTSINFGADTNLYRSQSNVLKTDSNLIVGTLTPNRAVYTNIDNKLTSSSTTGEELDYIHGVTSSVQNQLNSKVSLAGDIMYGTLTLPSGTLSNPALNFSGSLTTGFMTISGSLSMISNGHNSMTLTSDGSMKLPQLNTSGILHNNSSGLITSSLIINSDITPNTITNSSLATTSSSNIPSYIVVRDSNGNFETKMITLTGSPSYPTDVATKAYVDIAIQLGFNVDTPAVAISDTNITSLSGLMTIDSVELKDQQRVLLVGQTNKIQNGIYIVSTGAWTRSSDFANGTYAGAAYVLITFGYYYKGSAWVCNTPDAVIGTDIIKFVEFSLPNNAGGSNVGTGAGQIYQGTTGTIMNFKTLTSDQYINITNNLNDVQLAINGSSNNTVSNVVLRDSSGGFSAGTITANLTGSASGNLLLTGGTLSGNLSLPSGGSTSPSLLFTGSTNTGVSAVSNVLNLISNGVNVLSLSDSQVKMGLLSTGVVHASSLGVLSSSLITDSDIISSAGISNSKLATLTTAGLVSNSATTATNLNTASAIVARDNTGNFSAGTITANLIGSVTGSASGNLPLSGGTMTGALTLVSGNTTTPAINFTNSLNAGLSATSGALSLITNGVERLNVSSAGTISVNAFSSSGVVHNNAFGNLTSSLIVDADISSNAGIGNSKLATISQIGLVSNSATTATNNNTANAIVARDSSGNFSAGTITANFTSGTLSNSLVSSNSGGSLRNTLLGSGLSFNTSTGTLSNGGVLSIVGTVNQIGVNVSSGVATLYLATSPSFGRIGSSTIATQSVLIGDSTGTGAYNVAVGQQALQSCTTGQQNVGVGYLALISCTGNGNTAVGPVCATSLSTGINNVFIGNDAGRGSFALTTGSSCCYIGTSSYSSATNVNNEIVIGSTTGKGDGTAVINAGSGLHVTNLSGGILASTSTGKIQRSVGTDFISNVGTNNVLLGSNTTINTGTANVIIGYSSGTTINAGSRNIAIGQFIFSGASTALSDINGNNIGIGSNALTILGSTSSNNIGIGTAGQQMSTANNNIVIGNLAGQCIRTSSNNIAIGNNSMGNMMFLTTTDGKNVCLGNYSGYNINTTASANTCIGNNAMYSGSIISNNTCIGQNAGYYLTSGSNNTCVGGTSLGGTTTGSNNVAVGYNTLTGLTTGSYNTHLGINTQASSNTVSNEIVIGSDIMTTTGRGTNTCFINATSGLFSYMPAYAHFRSTNITSNNMYWNTTLFNQNISVSNQTVTFALAGLYQIIFSGSVQASNASALSGVLNINGTQYGGATLYSFYIHNSSTGSVYPLSFTIIYRMTAGSTMYMGTANIQGNGFIPSYLSITFIGL